MACLFPYFINTVPVPCGKCPKCLVRRADSWIFRILQEEKHSVSSHFLTLTYDSLSIPLSDNGFMTLRKRDVQLFFKRLRFYMWQRKKSDSKYIYTLPVKYYLAAEYGSKSHRPHYHLIILNADPYYFERAWSDDEGTIRGAAYFEDRPLTSDAIGYTTGYMNKPKVIPVHSRDDRVKEFSLMSKRFGLQYLSPEVVKYHLADFQRNFVTLPGGTKAALPRYYADRIYSEEDKLARRPFMAATIVEKYRKNIADYKAAFGDVSGFMRSQGEARAAAVRNFVVKSKNRKDL